VSESARALIVGKKNGDGRVRETIGEQMIDCSFGGARCCVNTENSYVFAGHNDGAPWLLLQRDWYCVVTATA
jgi:hypothetical protein